MEHKHHNHIDNHSTEAEVLALLKYMAHHNAHHAEELLETVASLEGNAAVLVKEAVELLNKSTEKINQAIKESEE